MPLMYGNQEPLLGTNIHFLVDDAMLKEKLVVPTLSMVLGNFIHELSFRVSYIIDILSPIQIKTCLPQRHLDPVEGESRVEVQVHLSSVVFLEALRLRDTISQSMVP